MPSDPRVSLHPVEFLASQLLPGILEGRVRFYHSAMICSISATQLGLLQTGIYTVDAGGRFLFYESNP